uniref:Uncharacterized protein n=1 Tax=Globodera rostochiensis TaxID=31243 RepID=A0A914H532_GLORO
MAPQSLVLVRLFCLVMLARHSIQWGALPSLPSGIPSIIGGNYKCYHSLYYVKKFDKDKLKALEEHILNKWHDKITDSRQSIQCYSDVGCETYRCQDARGNDIFVLNGCAKQKINDDHSTKCTLDVELGQFCSLKADRLAAPSCSGCYKEECNKKSIELGRKIDPNADLCYYSVRYANKKNPPQDLLSWLKKNMSITDKIRETFSCNGRVGCQIFRCHDNDGNDHFRVTGCVTDSGCKVLGQFCTKGRSKCHNCHGSKCNRKLTELQGNKAADNPKMYDGPNPGLRCLLKKICSLLIKQKTSKMKAVKLSRRFAPRWSKKSKKLKSKSRKTSLTCKNFEALDNKLKNVNDEKFNRYADLSEELEDSPPNEMNMMFMDEYLLAIRAVIDA